MSHNSRCIHNHIRSYPTISLKAKKHYLWHLHTTLRLNDQLLKKLFYLRKNGNTFAILCSQEWQESNEHGHKPKSNENHIHTQFGTEWSTGIITLIYDLYFDIRTDHNTPIYITWLFCVSLAMTSFLLISIVYWIRKPESCSQIFTVRDKQFSYYIKPI